MGKIITLGEIMLRLAPEGYCRLFQNDRMQATFGGAEANVAVGLSNFGEQTVFVTKLPVHAVGQAAVNELRSFGVDTSFIVRGGDRTGIYFMEKGAAQRSSICIYDRAGSAFATAEPQEFCWDRIFEDAEWFHFTGITPALSENVFQICLEACTAAKKLGIKVSCDLNYRAKLWTREAARKAMTILCSYVDVCIANEEDAENIFGIRSHDTDVYSGKINKKGYEDVAGKLCEKFRFSHVAFTLRKSHSAFINDWSGMLYDGQAFYYSKEYHIDHIVDRVGGGDSFGAGLIFGLKNGYAPQKAIEFAVDKLKMQAKLK